MSGNDPVNETAADAALRAGEARLHAEMHHGLHRPWHERRKPGEVVCHAARFVQQLFRGNDPGNEPDLQRAFGVDRLTH